MKSKNSITSTKSIIAVLSIAAFLISAGCGKNSEKKQTTKTHAKAKSEKTSISPLSLIPSSCDVISKINVAKAMHVKTITSNVVKSRNNNQETEKLKEIGLVPENINTIFIGLDSSSGSQKTPPNGISIISTKTSINMNKIVEYIKSKSDEKIASVKQGQYTLHIIPANDKQYKTAIVKIDDKVAIFGTETTVIKSLNLLSGKGDNVLKNSSLMNLVSKSNGDSLIWLAAVLPQDKINSLGQNSPKIKSGFITVNYDKEFKINGIINCPSPKDVNTIMAPLQMVTALIAMNPDSGLTANDIHISSEKNTITLNITIPQKAIDNLEKTKKMLPIKNLQVQ